MKTKPKSLGRIAFESVKGNAGWDASGKYGNPKINKPEWNRIAIAVKRAVIRDLRKKGMLK